MSSVLRRFRNRAAFHNALEAGTYRGRALHVTVMHDDDCTPSCCRCEPEFEIRDLTTESVIEGQQKQDAWMRRTQS